MDKVLTRLTIENSYEVQMTVGEDDDYSLLFKACSLTDWREEGNESVMVRVYVDNQYNQDIICFYGKQLFIYERLLGNLSKGTHTFRFEIMPLTKTVEVFIEDISFKRVNTSEEEWLVNQYSPLLYGRSVYGPFDQLHTDTPLLVIYFIKEWDKGKVLEYHVVFSHEDEGTPAPFLMAKWGRLLDIEYCIRVYLNEDHQVVKMEYQGANHIVKSYDLKTGLVSYPILQTATCNGNFTDEITSSYRARFVPKKWDPASQPREFVMESYPFVNQVMIWEAERQLEINEHKDGNSMELIHPCDYAYIQASFIDWDADTPPVEFLVKFRDENTWYSSSYHWDVIEGFEAVYTGEFPHFATTLKCPPGKVVQDIETIKPAVKPNSRSEAEIGGIRVYELEKDGLFTLVKEFDGSILGNDKEFQMDKSKWV